MYYLRYTIYVNTTFKKQSTFSDHLDTGKNCKGKDVTSGVLIFCLSQQFSSDMLEKLGSFKGV